MAWGFHYDDVDPEVVRAGPRRLPGPARRRAAVGLGHRPRHGGLWCLSPGRGAGGGGRHPLPVLVALGERDVLVDPRGELRAYESARSVDFFVCPRMGHMHNFAGTRELFWRRIETWAEWVRAVRTGGVDVSGARARRRPDSLLTLERVDRDLFRGRNANYGPRQTLYGGPGGGAVPARGGSHRRGRTASPTRCTATSCGPGAATCPSSSRSTATATGARSRPATSWPCRRAR